MMRFVVLLSGLLALSVLPGSKIWTQPGGDAREADDDKNVEVLTRGPVHEAFAQPYSTDPPVNPIVPKKPPDPVEEVPPDLKPEGDNVLWIPGYFTWDEETADFIWISGFWRDLPPGRVWVPGHWTQADGGWQWINGYWTTPSEREVEYLPVPPRSLETGPSVAAPEVDNLYAPGCWVYREDRYFWRPGFWYAPRADYIFVPATYVWTPSGCIFREGYWDYNLGRRGLLFSPVRFVAWEPGWHYRPQYTLSVYGVYASLFVRPDYHRYYFGDYYDPQYTRLGYTPWFQYRIASNLHDPLFSYYRWRHGKDHPDYEQRLVRTYEGRRDGTLPRPPASLREQHELVQRYATKDTKLATQLTLATPLHQVDKKAHRLQTLDESALAREVKVSKQIKSLVQERAKIEHHDGIKGAPPKAKGTPYRAKLDLPSLPEFKKGSVEHPAQPAVPKHIDRPPPKHEERPPLRVNPKPEVRPPSKQTPFKGQEINPPPRAKDFSPPPKIKEVSPPPRKELPPPLRVKDVPPPRIKEHPAPPKHSDSPKPAPRKEEPKKGKGKGDDSVGLPRMEPPVTEMWVGARPHLTSWRRGGANAAQSV